MKFFVILFSIYSFSALAQGNLETFRHDFESHIQHYDNQLLIASKLEFNVPSVQTEESTDFCHSLKRKIRKAYGGKIDPFFIKYGYGEAGAEICSSSKVKRIFFDEVSGHNNLGLSYTYVLHQVSLFDYVDVFGIQWQSSFYLYLDSNFKMIEMAEVITEPVSGKQFSKVIRSLDFAGNYFELQTGQKRLYEGTGYNGEFTRFSFAAADGSTGSPVQKTIKVVFGVSTKTYESVEYNVSLDSCWNHFSMPLTFAGFGGFYFYPYTYRDGTTVIATGSLKRKSLTIKSVNGKDVCGMGEVEEMFFDTKQMVLTMVSGTLLPTSLGYRNCRDLDDF